MEHMGPPPPASTSTQPSPQKPPLERKKSFLIYFGVFFLICAAVFIWWFFWLRFEKYTDDAYVTGNMVALTPQISGIVVSINADETNFVQKDQVIIELDTIDPMLAYEARRAELAQALRRTISLFEKVGTLKAEMERRRAELWKHALDYEHRKPLVATGGVSVEDFEHAEADLRASYAALLDVEHEKIAAVAEVDRTTVLSHPLVDHAMQKLREAYVHLQRCKIVAPVTGLVAQRKAQVGERVMPGEPLLAIIPLDEIWVYANYKETQLRKMRIGQKARMTADIYGRSVVFHGEVVGIAGGTGSVFSIIPPQNATGNWIKIVQRLPVKISFDPKEIQEHPLRLGLSMKVTVDLHDTQGSTIPPAKDDKPVYETDVFEKQILGAEEAIIEIIKENVSPFFLERDYYLSLFSE